MKITFRNDVRYVGLAPERLFVTTCGTSVRRKRVNSTVDVKFSVFKNEIQQQFRSLFFYSVY